jgi:HD superfamily phosphohydrolase
MKIALFVRLQSSCPGERQAMPKLIHELRDGIHGFILFDLHEKALIDSEPMQRLRCIHQLAMCYQVYPGATHKRFEHSLGVMEVATRIFDKLFNGRIADSVEERIGEELQEDTKSYWRRVVRLAGLLHDVGHLPFSHAAEEQLLPHGWNHERITAEIITKSEIARILKEQKPSIDPDDIVDVAWDIKKRAKVEPDKVLSPWKTLLNEIICGNTFGADRIDYLLRDSWHSGVAYGRFDPDRLITGLLPLIDPNNGEISLGLDHGAIHSAEALLLARYFMYTQVYFHDVRRVYDIHLKEFLQAWRPDGKLPSDWTELMQLTDHEVLTAMRLAARDPSSKCHELATRVLSRKHFRTIYELVSPHKRQSPRILEELKVATIKQFGQEKILSDQYGPKSETNDFLIHTDDNNVVSSSQVSGVIATLPPIEIGLIFAHPSIANEARTFVNQQLKTI